MVLLVLFPLAAMSVLHVRWAGDAAAAAANYQNGWIAYGSSSVSGVNHSFRDGPPVQSQTSASPLIAEIFVLPWGPPGGEDCHSRRRRGGSACSVSRTG